MITADFNRHDRRFPPESHRADPEFIGFFQNAFFKRGQFRIRIDITADELHPVEGNIHVGSALHEDNLAQ